MRHTNPKHPATRTIRAGVGSSPDKRGLLFVELAFDTRDPKYLLCVTDTSVVPPETWYEVIVGRKRKIIYVGEDLQRTMKVYKEGRRSGPGSTRHAELMDQACPREVGGRIPGY